MIVGFVLYNSDTVVDTVKSTDICGQNRASGGTAPGPPPGALPLDPTGALKRAPGPHAVRRSTRFALMDTTLWPPQCLLPCYAPVWINPTILVIRWFPNYTDNTLKSTIISLWDMHCGKCLTSFWNLDLHVHLVQR